MFQHYYNKRALRQLFSDDWSDSCIKRELNNILDHYIGIILALRSIRES